VPAWEQEPSDIGLGTAHRTTSTTVRDVAGYRKKNKQGDGWDYFITSTGWKEIYAGFDQRRAAAVLAQSGGLITDGKEHKAKLVRIPGEGPRRVYHIPSAFLEADHDA
jgi:putative DNA primase/helicase